MARATPIAAPVTARGKVIKMRCQAAEGAWAATDGPLLHNHINDSTLAFGNAVPPSPHLKASTSPPCLSRWAIRLPEQLVTYVNK